MAAATQAQHQRAGQRGRDQGEQRPKEADPDRHQHEGHHLCERQSEQGSQQPYGHIHGLPVGWRCWRDRPNRLCFGAMTQICVDERPEPMDR